MKKTLAFITFTLLVNLVGAARAMPPVGVGWGASQDAGAQKKGPQWKSNDEYNAFQAVAKETDPNKRISLAEAFLQKFADTDFKDLAYLQEVGAYQQLGDAAKMYQASRKAVGANPDNFDALYWACVSFPYTFKLTDANSSQELSQAESDGRHGLEVAQKAQKPTPNVSDEQWALVIKTYRATFNGLVGFVALQRKDYAAAITSFKAASEDTPNDFYTFYRLGLGYWYSSPPDYDNAAWYMARSASLARAAKNQFEADVMKDLKQLYEGYHGSDAGLEDIISQAAGSPNPPAGFKVTPAERHKPTGNQAIDYFYGLEDTLKAGGDQAKQAWEQAKGQSYGYAGKVVSAAKGTDPDTTLVGIAMTDESKAKDAADIVLKDKQADAKYLAKGDLLRSFTGNISEYTMTPGFSLTLEGTIDDDSLAAAKEKRAKEKAKARPKPKAHTTAHPSQSSG